VERESELLVSWLGHDLRNPLSTILAGIEMLEARPCDERERILLHRLHGSAERMSRMIDQLLDFARSRLGGGIPIERRSLDLGELCAEVIGELEQATRIAIPLERIGDCTGEWDRDRLAEVISNLVGNALQHGERGTTTLSVDGRESEVELTCRNHGAPIPGELMTHLFDPFHGGRSHTTRSSGLGLGLYIVARIIEQHGGRISVSSSSDGTCFNVRLPRRAGNA
jgi:signal transduction histidine kinase